MRGVTACATTCVISVETGSIGDERYEVVIGESTIRQDSLVYVCSLIRIVTTS